MNILDSLLLQKNTLHYLTPQAAWQEARTLIALLQGEEQTLCISENGEPLPLFLFGKGEILSLWIGFPDALSALGGLSILHLMEMVLKYPQAFAPYRFCVIPCFTPEEAKQNSELFSGVEEMYSFSQNYYWNPENQPALSSQHPLSRALDDWIHNNHPQIVFPLFDETLLPFPKLSYFTFAQAPEKTLAHQLRQILKEGNHPLHQKLHPYLGKAGFLLEEWPEKAFYQDIFKKYPCQIFWTSFGSITSEELYERKMSPYTTVELADEEEHLAQKIERELFSLLPLTQKTPYLPALCFYQNRCLQQQRKKEEEESEESLFINPREVGDFPHITLGEWRAFQGNLLEQVSRMGIGIRHLSACGEPIEAYEFAFLELMDEYKKTIPYGRIPLNTRIRTQLLSALRVLSQANPSFPWMF
jgi:hypothetical protein